MHEEPPSDHVTQAQIAEESQVLGRKPRRRFLADHAGADVVARERRVPAVGNEDLAVVAPELQVAEEHVLVVAAQKDGARPLVAYPEHAVDELAGRGAAVDVVAEEHEGIVRRRADVREQDVELVGTSVKIADGVETHPHLRS